MKIQKILYELPIESSVTQDFTFNSNIGFPVDELQFRSAYNIEMLSALYPTVPTSYPQPIFIYCDLINGGICSVIGHKKSFDSFAALGNDKYYAVSNFSDKPYIYKFEGPSEISSTFTFSTRLLNGRIPDIDPQQASTINRFFIEISFVQYNKES